MRPPSSNASYVLTHPLCEVCVWSEDGFYNSVCAHCKYVTYGKKEEPGFMTREIAESLGLVKKKDEDEE